MKKLLFLIAAATPLLLFAHGGEDHGAPKKPATALQGTTYISSQNTSDLYEVLIKYAPVMPGKGGKFTLYLSNAVTNAPIDSADIKLSVSDDEKILLPLTRTGKGIYQFTGTFPAKKSYTLVAAINAPLGADLMQIEKLDIGKELEAVATDASPAEAWYTKGWVLAVAGLLLGLLVMYFLMRTKNRRVAIASMLLLCLVPAATYNTVSAHGGEDHSGGAAKPAAAASTSSTFLVEKESQYLFNIITDQLHLGDFYKSSELFGTVIPAPQGRAVIQTPQTGKIIALRVRPGQNVSKGQVLAVVQQQVDAGTQINIISQRNSTESEYQAAKAQYDRLMKIQDIAAKRDITEAKSRLEAAQRNRSLFQSNISGGSTKLISLTSPISGIVGAFNYAIGAVVNSGETLFEITNLNNVYVEAQVFTGELQSVKDAKRFTASSSGDTVAYPLRMISNAQTVNQANQSQTVIFEIVNSNGRFKIGEAINVRMYLNSRERAVVVPKSAITEINGKPAVFIKDNAEQFSVSFVSTGESNESGTAILKGVEQGEKIVIQNVYQMKMIYLNQ